MLVAGEASADVYGARLVQALQERCPGAWFFGMGGPAMRQAGVHLLYDATHRGTVGVVEAVRDLPLYRRLLFKLTEAARRLRPDACVLLDFPGFNLRLGPMVHRLGVPVAYYVAPAVWAWGAGRARQVASFARRVLCVFDFEVPLYRAAGAQAQWVGHPVLEDLPPRPQRREACQALGLAADSPVVALLPGSRMQELQRLLPVMLEAAGRAASEHPELQFVVSLAPGLKEQDIAHISSRVRGAPPFTLVGGGIWRALGPASFALVASGTATLQAALWQVPMAVVYRVSAATYHLARRVVRLPYIALPNIVAGAPVVQEFLQSAAEPRRLAAAILEHLQGGEPVERLRAALGRVRERLGEPGASARAAEAVLEMVGS